MKLRLVYDRPLLLASLIVLVCVTLPCASAESISLALPDPLQAQAGINFTESYWIPAFFGSGGASLTDGAINSKGKTALTSNGSGTGVGLYFYDGDGTASEGSTQYIAVQGIAAASDNDFWFVDGLNVNAVGVVTSKWQITEYAPTTFYFTGGITLGSDGAMWAPSVSYSPSQQQVTRVASNGTFTSYTLPLTEIGVAIATGSDKNVWVQGVSYAGEGNYDEELLSVTPSGQVTSYATGTVCDGYETYYLHNVILGPDGNIWFSSGCGLGIGNITPSGVVTFFPFTNPNTELPFYTLASGSDGAVWFTAHSNYIGRIDTSGNVTYTAITNSLGNYNTCANGQVLNAQTIFPGPKGTLQFYATDTANGIETCGTVVSFTPKAPGAKQARQTSPEPQVNFGCEGGEEMCQFIILGAANTVRGTNLALFGLDWTALDVNGYYTQIFPGENFGLCNATSHGNPLYAYETEQPIGTQMDKYGNPMNLWAFAASGFSAKETGLKEGKAVTCNFTWLFQSCPPAQKCVTDNEQTITFHAIVGP